MRVAGFGFRTGADLASLRTALEAVGRTGLTGFATAEDKADAPALRALAAELVLPIHAIPLAQLAAQRTHTLSPAQPMRYGAGSVAEASALAACGAGARLIKTRVVSPDGMATAAIAEGNGQ